MTARRVQTAVAGVALLGFCALTAALLDGALAAFDDRVRTDVHALAAPWLTASAEVLTHFGSVAALTVFTAVEVLVLVRLRMRDEAKFVFILMAGALATENIVKFSVRRLRPPPFFGADPTTYSFPSGHALLSLCFYGSLAIVLIRRGAPPLAAWAIAVCAAAAIGFTRIYLGVHYPTDVLAGYTLAIAWLCGALAARPPGAVQASRGQ